MTNFIKEIRSIPIPENAPNTGRQPLKDLNQKAKELIINIDQIELQERVLGFWERSVNAEPFADKKVWLHSDLIPTNILINDDKIIAIIDFGSVGIGDPAFDLIPAWTIFSKKGRNQFQKKMNPDENTWERARGYALIQCLLIIPYYKNSFPEFVEMAYQTINQIIDL